MANMDCLSTCSSCLYLCQACLCRVSVDRSRHSPKLTFLNPSYIELGLAKATWNYHRVCVTVFLVWRFWSIWVACGSMKSVVLICVAKCLAGRLLSMCLSVCLCVFHVWPGGHKVSTKENLLAPFSLTFFSRLGWNMWWWSNWSLTSRDYIWVRLIETREITAVLQTV